MEERKVLCVLEKSMCNDAIHYRYIIIHCYYGSVTCFSPVIFLITLSTLFYCVLVMLQSKRIHILWFLHYKLKYSFFLPFVGVEGLGVKFNRRTHIFREDTSPRS